MTTLTPSHHDDAPPIACTLGAGGMQDRIAEWHTVLAHVVDRTPVPNGLRLTFRQHAPLAEISRLAAAEVHCCAFFTMTLRFSPSSTTLEVTAPTEAQPFLELLFGAAA